MEDRFRDILGAFVDVDEVRAEAVARYGDRVSGEILLAIALRHIAEKNRIEMQHLIDNLFIKSPTLQELEDQGKISGVPGKDDK